MADREYIKFRTFVYLRGEEKTIEIYKEERIKKIEVNELLNFKIYLNDKDFDTLVNELNKYKMQEWKEEYINLYVLDGMEWDLEYNINGSKKSIHGQNDYPTNWDEVEEILFGTIEKVMIK